MTGRAPAAAETPSLGAAWVFSPLSCTAANGSFSRPCCGPSPRRASVPPRISSSEAPTQHPPTPVVSPARGWRGWKQWRLRKPPTTTTHCLRQTLFRCGFCLYLDSSRETLFIQFERGSNTSANLRRLLSRQERVVIWQSASQLLNNTENFTTTATTDHNSVQDHVAHPDMLKIYII